MRRALYPALMGIALIALATTAGILLAPDTPRRPAAAATPIPTAAPQFYRIRFLFSAQERGLDCRTKQQMTHVVFEQADDGLPREYYALGQPDETVVWLGYEKAHCLVGITTDQPLPARFRR